MTKEIKNFEGIDIGIKEETKIITSTERGIESMCDSLLINELEARGFLICSKPKSIECWKNGDKVIEIEELGGYHYIGETKDFTEEEFKNIVKQYICINKDEIVDICKEYFKLEIVSPFVVENIVQNQRLVKCDKSTEGAIEMWGTIE